MSRSMAIPADANPGATPPLPPPLYRMLRSWLRPWAARFFSLTVEGIGFLPSRGPYIIAANHHNYLDGVVLGLVVPEPVAFMVMPRVYRATPLHPFFHDRIGSIVINLERPDLGALRRALRTLQEGRIVGIFPEGASSVRGRLEPGLPGVALLALRSRVPVVPAGIRGTYEALSRRRFYVPRRYPVRVRFGPARHFAPADGPGPRLARADVTAQVMSDIAALLPD